MNGTKGQRARMLVFFLLLISAMGQTARAYVHPGGLHTQADLDRMKTQVAAAPIPGLMTGTCFSPTRSRRTHMWRPRLPTWAATVSEPIKMPMPLI
jgi:hypothetical protein